MPLTESTIEDPALKWLGDLRCAVGYGPHLAPNEQAAWRNRSPAEMVK
jgi:hypothetical protein